MKVIVLSLFLATILITSESHAESYQDCIIKNMKNVNDRLAAYEIKKSCLDKTTPKKCRKYLAHNIDSYRKSKKEFKFDEIVSPETLLPKCLSECEKAGFFERKIGECSTD